MRGVTGACRALRKDGFVWLRSEFATPSAAFAYAQDLIEERHPLSGHGVLSVIGDFILPPPDGDTTRDFQTLHFDFGVPLNPRHDQDVARYTALFVPRWAVGVTAVTRLVPLDALLGQRRWPAGGTLLSNLIAYGESNGAWAVWLAWSRRPSARRGYRA
jgi:hypothetical protein